MQKPSIATLIKGIEVTTTLGPIHVHRVNMMAISVLSEALRSDEALPSDQFVRLLLGAICRLPADASGSSRYLSSSELDGISDSDRELILRTLWRAQGWGEPAPEGLELVDQVIAHVRQEIVSFTEHTAKLLEPLQGVLGKSTSDMFLKSAGLAARLQELADLGRTSALVRRAQEIAERTSGLGVGLQPSAAISVAMEAPRIDPVRLPPPPKDYSGGIEAIEAALQEMLELDRAAAASLAATQTALTGAILKFEAKRIDDQVKESRKLRWAVGSLVLTAGIACASFIQDYRSNHSQDVDNAAVIKALEGQQKSLERIGRGIGTLSTEIASQRTAAPVGEVARGKQALPAPPTTGGAPNMEGTATQGQARPTIPQGHPSKPPDTASKIQH
ncbi:MAG: hypothetical protein ACOY33_10580 [Pseudomonadota bacterium]